MPGVRANQASVNDTVQAYSGASGPVTAGQILWEYASPINGRIIGLVCNSTIAGVGAGNTVLDVLKNGTSVFTTTANRPTLLGTGTGEFANTLPDDCSIRKGDTLQLKVLTIPATTGAQRVMMTLAIGDA